jgi:hypothetical protein
MGSPRSVNIKDKKKFMKHVNSLTNETKILFEQLKEGVLNRLKNCDHGYTDRPDFRFAHKYVFCHIDLLKRPERLQIRLKYSQLNYAIEKIIECYGFYNNSIMN